MENSFIEFCMCSWLIKLIVGALALLVFLIWLFITWRSIKKEKEGTK